MNTFRTGLGWIGVCLGLCAMGPAWADLPAQDAAQLKVLALEQLDDQLADFESRRAAAERQTDRAERFFQGALVLDAAFPGLADRPLGDPAFLLSAQLAHEERISVRALQRLETGPAHLSEEDRTRWVRARDAAVSAEDLSALQSMRLIGGIKVGLDRAPAFRETRIRKAVEVYEAARAELGALDPEDPELRLKAEQLSRWADAEARAEAYRREALDAMSIAGDPGLAELVVGDLEAAEGFLAQIEASEEAEPLREDFGVFDRLGWVRDLVSVEQQEAIGGIEQRLAERERRLRIVRLREDLAAVELELGSVGTVETGKSLEVLAIELEEARAARLVLPTADLLLEDEEIQLQLQVAQVREEVAQVRLDQAEETVQADLEVSATNQEELAQAQARAEEARRQAEQARGEDDQPTAALREQVLRFSDQAAFILLDEVGTDEAPGRSPQARLRIADLRDDLETARMAASAAQGMAPLVPGRQEAIDNAWSELRGVVEAVRAEVWHQHQERTQILLELQTLLEGLPDPGELGDSSQNDALVGEWRVALNALKEVILKQEENLVIELDGSLELLTEAKIERRRLREKVSAARAREAQTDFLPELLSEMREVPLQFYSDARTWSRVGGNLSAWLMDISLVGAAIWGFIELFVLIGLWVFIRRPLKHLMEVWTGHLQHSRLRPDSQRGRIERVLDRVLEHGDYRAAAPLLSKLAVDFSSILLIGLCLLVLGDRLPLIGLVFMVWQIRNCVRAGPGLASLLFVGPGQIWPAWRRVSEIQRALIQRTVWLVSLWLGLDWLLHGIALDIMDADRLNDMVDIGVLFVWTGLIIRLLARWAPDIRRAVERRGNDRFTPWVAKAWTVSVLHSLQALAGLVYLIWLFLIRFSVRLLSTRRGLSWLTALVMRTQLKESKDILDPIGSEQIERLRNGASLELVQSEEIAQAQRCLRDWRETRQRGMVMLTGDRGSGKSRFMNQLENIFGAVQSEGDVLSVLRLECPLRSMNQPNALCWLAESLEISLESPTLESLIDAIINSPPKVIAVDDLHQSFRRTVGGFDGLVALLQVMHMTSEKHFWVVSMHEPAWRFLRGVPGAVNLSVFRDRVALRPLSSQEACSWLENRALNLGLRLDYEHLIGEVLPGVDRERALSRSKEAFWRLLVQSCQGNPQIVLHYWLLSLRIHAKPDRMLLSLFSAPSPASLQDGDDSTLFLLTALIIHDGLDVDDIAAVLNLSEGESLSICRQLESRGVLRIEGGAFRFGVELSWLPAVERILQQKHFFHAQD